MPTYRSDGAELYFRDSGGQKNRLPVLLLHGFSLNGESFRPQYEALGDQYRFLIPDIRGFGRSASLGSAAALTMSQIARDAVALLDHLELSGAAVGGCSMGGYAAMAMLRENPARVQKLLLIDTRDTEDDDAGRRGREETARNILDPEKGLEPFISEMLPKLLSPNAPEKLKDALKAQIRAASLEGIATAARGMALRPDSRELLTRFGGPALVIVGEYDTVTPPPAARAMADRISGGMLEVVPDAGHISHFERPEVFNRMLDAFLSRF